PDQFTAEPRVHLGSYFKIDVCAYEDDDTSPRMGVAAGSGNIATATWAPPEPTLSLDADLTDQHEYEVLVYDQSRRRHLVAAVEIVSWMMGPPVVAAVLLTAVCISSASALPPSRKSQT